MGNSLDWAKHMMVRLSEGNKDSESAAQRVVLEVEKLEKRISELEKGKAATKKIANEILSDEQGEHRFLFQVVLSEDNGPEINLLEHDLAVRLQPVDQFVHGHLAVVLLSEGFHLRSDPGPLDLVLFDSRQLSLDLIPDSFGSGRGVLFFAGRDLTHGPFLVGDRAGRETAPGDGWEALRLDRLPSEARLHNQGELRSGVGVDCAGKSRGKSG